MILESREDKKGDFFRAGMIERLSVTMENYASSEWGNRFYSDEYLAGFCARRNEIQRRVTKATGALLSLTTLLAFLGSIQGTITFWGITFSVPQTGALALSVFVAAATLAFVFALLDQLIIDRLLYTLGARIGAHQFELVLLNYTANNLWTLATTPKYHGITSEWGHKSVQLFLALFFLLLFGAFFAYPIAVVVFTLKDHLADGASTLEIILIAATVLIFLFAVFIMLSFSFNYKFRPAKLSEPSEPFVPENFLELGHPITPPKANQEQPAEPDPS